MITPTNDKTGIGLALTGDIDTPTEDARKDAIRALLNRYRVVSEELTENQFVEAIKQALPDFKKLVCAKGQRVVYLPWQEAEKWKALYHELILAVETACDGETRHETALKYIREREMNTLNPQTDR